MKKILSFLMVTCLLLGGLVSFTFAEALDYKGDAEVALIRLEKEKKRNLKSTKEQLEEQDMMEHYVYYEELIDLEYNALKDQLEGNISLMNMMTRPYKLTNGGQIQYRLEPSSDKRTHASFVVDSYNKRMTVSIINKYDKNNRITLKNINSYIIGNLLSFKIPAIGPIIIAIDGGLLLKNYFTAKRIGEIERSVSKCLQVSSVSSAGGKSTVWGVWSDTPYVYIHKNAIKVKVKSF